MSRRVKPIFRYPLLGATLFLATTLWAQDAALIEEPGPDGLLGCATENFKVRNTYLICYDTDRRVPRGGPCTT